MKVYTVHEPQAPASDRLDRAENLSFVGDGFHWTAALFAPFVLIGQQLWLGVAIYAAAMGAVCALMYGIGASPSWIGLAVIALHVIVGFEFNELCRLALDAKGWTNVGTVSGRTREDCERRFFDDWLPHQPMIAGLGARSQTPTTQASEVPKVDMPTQPSPRWRFWKS